MKVQSQIKNHADVQQTNEDRINKEEGFELIMKLRRRRNSQTYVQKSVLAGCMGEAGMITTFDLRTLTNRTPQPK